jgi:hypothetical protein
VGKTASDHRATSRGPFAALPQGACCAIANAWPDAPFRGLILLGDHKTIAALQTILPSAFEHRIVHTGPYSWARKEPNLDAKVQDVLDDVFRQHDARLIEELERRLNEHHLIAAGPQEVINALWNGQVGYPGISC